DYAKLTKELETWKQLVAKILPGPERDAALDQIREREKAFAGLQTNERSFFQRLVSGQELVHQADVERTKIDHLLQKFLEQGNDIEIGKISAYPVLQSRKDFQVTVPVTLKTTRSATSTLRDIASLLSTVVRSSVDMKFVGHLPRIGSKFQANAKGHLILLSDTSYRTHYYLKRLQDTKLTLELRSPDEHSLTSCAILGIERLLTAYHYEVTNDGTYNFHLGAQFFSPNSTILIEDGATVEVDFVLSESTVKKLGVVTAKFVFIESRDAIKPCTVC
ncbi:MAG: hypothetical protein ACREI2_07725, partial [Nitrospiraceae bacterium]